MRNGAIMDMFWFPRFFFGFPEAKYVFSCKVLTISCSRILYLDLLSFLIKYSLFSLVTDGWGLWMWFVHFGKFIFQTVGMITKTAGKIWRKPTAVWNKNAKVKGILELLVIRGRVLSFRHGTLNLLNVHLSNPISFSVTL